MAKKIVFTILILTTMALVLAACGSAATQSSGRHTIFFHWHIHHKSMRKL